MDQQLLIAFPGIEMQEIMFIQEALKDATESQQKNFILIYQNRRKDPQIIMICTLIGFIGVSGIQRILLGQIGMGILYFLTGGLCLIGTIVDLVNYKKITFEFNQKMVVESKMLASSM
jgi:TM2 domain-containing membrane protein YozV